uniref:Uncharacterized protein n=1 Tax=Globodera rostochiensis TaxID=31243 RepID=A0A914GUA4_GLORO
MAIKTLLTLRVISVIFRPLEMRGEARDPKSEATAEAVSVEKQQEIQLMNKLASTGKLPPKSASNFLQKKLQQRKFFDSGDYNMNKNKPVPPPMGQTPNAGTTPKLAVPVESELDKKMEELVQFLVVRWMVAIRTMREDNFRSRDPTLCPSPHIHHEHTDESLTFPQS